MAAKHKKELTEEQKEKMNKKKLKKAKAKQKLQKKLVLSLPVPEGLKKAWERENRAASIRKKIRESKKAALPKKRERQAQRIKNYEEEYAKIKQNELENIKAARLNGNFYKPEDAKVAIVIRIRGYFVYFFIFELSESTK